jgi:predicted ester cyclase
MVVEGEKVWVRFTIRGTHQGLLRNIPATHKQITYSQIAMYRVANGRIVEVYTLTDDISLLRQLGAFPS